MSGKEPFDVSLERYLAGTMEAAELEAFMERVDGNPEWTEKLGESLVESALFAEAFEADRLLRPARHGTRVKFLKPGRASRAPFVAAAVLLLAAGAAVLFSLNGFHPGETAEVKVDHPSPEKQPEGKSPVVLPDSGDGSMDPAPPGAVSPAPVEDQSKSVVVEKGDSGSVPEEPEPERVKGPSDVTASGQSDQIEKQREPEVKVPAKQDSERTISGLARLEGLEGTVEITSSGKKSTAKLNVWMGPDDLLTVGEDGRATLGFHDGTRIELKASTTVRIPGQETSGVRSESLILSKGGFSANVPELGKGELFRVGSDDGWISGEGTQYRCFAQPGGTVVEVGKGDVCVGIPGVIESNFIPSGISATLSAKGLVLAVLQDEPPDLDFEATVLRAIADGVSSLKDAKVPGHKPDDGNELILLTYVHAGVEESDPHFRALLKESLEDELQTTYTVVLTAMALEELDRVKYQWRIHQCAQFLVDNIGPDGEARYGQPTDLSHIPSWPPDGLRDTRTSGGTKDRGEDGNLPGDTHQRIKPKVRRMIHVKQRRQATGGHDHSNMQYLALGLRACRDAGIIFDPQMIRKCREWWIQNQAETKDPFGVLLVDAPVKKASKRKGRTRADRVMRLKATARGWSYTGKGGGHDGIKGSMTAGAVGTLCIFDSLLGQDWRRNQAVLDGLQWLAGNFEVKGNPIDNGNGVSDKWHYYYLYGLERAGILFGTETIGTHRWYREGADYLLDNMKGKGWGSHSNTCFAILFLRRATHRLPEPTGR